MLLFSKKIGVFFNVPLSPPAQYRAKHKNNPRYFTYMYYGKNTFLSMF